MLSKEKMIAIAVLKEIKKYAKLEEVEEVVLEIERGLKRKEIEEIFQEFGIKVTIKRGNKNVLLEIYTRN